MEVINMSTTANQFENTLQIIKWSYEEIRLTSFTHKGKVYNVDEDLMILDAPPKKALNTNYKLMVTFLIGEIISPIESRLAEFFGVTEADFIYKRHFLLDFDKLTVEDNNIYIHYLRPDIKILLDTDLDIDTITRKIPKAIYDNAMIQLSDSEIRVIKETRSFIG